MLNSANFLSNNTLENKDDSLKLDELMITLRQTKRNYFKLQFLQQQTQSLLQQKAEDYLNQQKRSKTLNVPSFNVQNSYNSLIFIHPFYRIFEYLDLAKRFIELSQKDQQLNTQLMQYEQQKQKKRLFIKDLLVYLKQVFKDIASLDEGVSENDIDKKQIVIHLSKLTTIQEQIYKEDLKLKEITQKFVVTLQFPKENDEAYTEIYQNSMDKEVCDNFILIQCFIKGNIVRVSDEDELFQFLETFNHDNNQCIYTFKKQSSQVLTQFQVFIFEKNLIQKICQKIDESTLLSIILIDYLHFISYGNKSKDEVTKQRTLRIQQVQSVRKEIQQRWEKQIKKNKCAD